MEFNLTNLLPSNWLHAFGATLFHSLWLGVLLSFLVALVMFLTRKASSAFRYNLLTGSLCLFVGTIAVIFYKILGNQSIDSVALMISPDAKDSVQLSSSVYALGTNMLTSVNGMMNVWNAYASQIVLVWFMIICAKSIQLFAGLNSIYQLRNNEVYTVGRKWNKKLNELSDGLGIKQTVSILQSGIAQVPMVLGHFKPLILIPVGLLNGLSSAEVEAILCHELAHIKRRDYLVNLLQSIIEIVFFFNPAVLWVSKLIRNERENCCDDLAISQMHDKRNYVNALITCQEFQLNMQRFAMAVTGEKNHLFQRISRMLCDTKTTLNKIEKTILTISLISVVICSAAFKNGTYAGKSTKNYVTDAAWLAHKRDTTKKKFLEKLAGQKSRKESQLASKLKSEKCLAERKAEYAEALKKHIANQQKYEKDQLNYQKSGKTDLESQKKYAKQNKEWAKKDKEWVKQNAQWNNESKSCNKSQLSLQPKPAIKLSPASEISKQFESTKPLVPLSLFTPPASSACQSTPSLVLLKVTKGDDHDYANEINQELRKDGIISTTNKLSYKLSKDDLIVNGVKQTANFHQRYKDKYLKRDNRSLCYNYNLTTNQ